jgi:hypothetical protein
VSHDKPKFNVSLVGGLGNQLFQYAHIRSNHPAEVIGLAFTLDEPRTDRQSPIELTNLSVKNYSIVDPPKGHKHTLRLIHNVILRFSNSRERLRRWEFLGRITQRLFSILFYFVTLGKWGVDSQASLGYDKDFKPGLKKRNLQIGYFQHCHWNESFVQSLKDLKLNNPSKLFLDISQSLAGKRVLVVHLRFGDYLLEDNFGVPTKGYFKNAISYHLSKHNYDEILLFTNERIRAEEYIAGFGQIGIRLIAEDAELNPAENLELMRFGSGYVISNSTFSWWGAFLCHDPNPVVICPNPWFSGYDEPAELIPPNWIRMGMQ